MPTTCEPWPGNTNATFLLATTPPLLFAILRLGFVANGIYFGLDAAPDFMRHTLFFWLFPRLSIVQGLGDAPIHLMVDSVARQTNRALDCQCTGAAMRHDGHTFQSNQRRT